MASTLRGDAHKHRRDEEFTHFVSEAQDSLTGTAWLLTGNRQEAADLVQGALVKVYVAWPRVRTDEALAYARRTLVNEHTDRWRRGHGEVLDDRAGESVAVDDATQAVGERDAVMRMLDGLPPNQRRVVVLRYFCDMSEREIANALNISTGAVKSAASRALASLRAQQQEGVPA